MPWKDGKNGRKEGRKEPKEHEGRKGGRGEGRREGRKGRRNVRGSFASLAGMPAVGRSDQRTTGPAAMKAECICK